MKEAHLELENFTEESCSVDMGGCSVLQIESEKINIPLARG